MVFFFKGIKMMVWTLNFEHRNGKKKKKRLLEYLVWKIRPEISQKKKRKECLVWSLNI